MKRGDVYEARLDPVEGSEQSGVRPVVIVSRESLNEDLNTVVAVPFSTFRERELYPSHALVRAPEGGLAVDSLALGEQVRVLSRRRLLRQRGSLSPESMERVDAALRIALDLED